MSRSQLFGILVTGYVLTLVLSFEVFSQMVDIDHHQLSAGVLPFPLTYFFLDIATEILGYRHAKRMILIGLAAISILGFLQYAMVLLPDMPGAVTVANAYKLMNQHDIHFVVCGVAAILLADFFNAKVLTHLKVLTKGRYFGLRSFASTIGGEVVNTFLAFGIGFWGLLSYHHVVALVASCLLYKSIASLILNPPTVLVVHFLKSRVVHKAPAFATFNPFHSEQDKTK